MTPAAATLQTLERGRDALLAMPAERLAAAWAEAIAELRDPLPGFPAAELRERMADSLGFSRPGLDAGLEIVLDSVAGPDALALFTPPPATAAGPLLVFLAATPPGLAAQALLPALALRRPMMMKTAGAEPHFAPFLIDLLTRREPAIGAAVAAASWRGGDRAVEDPLLAAAGQVIAYGGAEAMADLAARCPSFFGFGPKLSVAIVGPDADLAATARGLARDVVLFDQRGCLSVQLILTVGDALALAGSLATALAEQAAELPPGPASLAELAEVRLLREEAELRGCRVAPLPLRQGTVIVETVDAPLSPSPGWRTVRIHPLDNFEQAIARLAPWQGFLQGAVLAGGAEVLADPLRALGVTRVAPPGELQHAGVAGWPNGGRPVLEIFGSAPTVLKNTVSAIHPPPRV